MLLARVLCNAQARIRAVVAQPPFLCPKLHIAVFEGVGTEAAKMAVSAFSIVEHLDVLEDLGTRHSACLSDAFRDRKG